MSDKSKGELLRGTVEIVENYLSKTTVPEVELPALIINVGATLQGLSAQEAAPAAPKSAVPVKQSVRPDAIVCLECGKPMQMLKRHLRSAHGLTPTEYRERWGLPADYPMTTFNYAEERSRMAKRIGLGTRTGRQRGAKAAE